LLFSKVSGDVSSPCGRDIMNPYIPGPLFAVPYVWKKLKVDDNIKKQEKIVITLIFFLIIILPRF
jgi:hypothetical protein